MKGFLPAGSTPDIEFGRGRGLFGQATLEQAGEVKRRRKKDDAGDLRM